QTTTSATPRKMPSAQAVADELQQLKDDRALERKQIEALQQEVTMLKDEMRKRDAALEQAQAATVAAQGKADQVASQSSQQQQTVADLSTDVKDLKLNATNSALSLQETQK